MVQSELVNRLLHQIIMKIGRHVNSSSKWQKASFKRLFTLFVRFANFQTIKLIILHYTAFKKCPHDVNIKFVSGIGRNRIFSLNRMTTVLTENNIYNYRPFLRLFAL